MKPATPLPWKAVSERANEGMGAPVETEVRGANRQVAIRLGRLYSEGQKQDAAYIVHAANEYPKLEALVAELPLIAFQPSNNGERWDEGYKAGWDAAMNAVYAKIKEAK